MTASCPRPTASQLRLTISHITPSSESESYVTTDGQSASLPWNKAPIWGLRPDLCYRQTVAGLFMWGAASDERTGLSFTTAADLRQRSHSRVRVPWHSWPYFTVSDSRLPFSSPPTTRRVTVEVFDPACTRVSYGLVTALRVITFREPIRDERLQWFQYCVCLRYADYACNTVVTKSSAQQRTCIRWQCNTRNVFSQPLPSNGRLLWLTIPAFRRHVTI
jgi:hypothetical protein